MAFNKSNVQSIQDDVIVPLRRSDITVQALTFHSFANNFLPHSPTRQVKPSWKFESLSIMSGSGEYQINTAAVDLVGKIQNTMTNFQDENVVARLMDEYDIGVQLTDEQRLRIRRKALYLMSAMQFNGVSVGRVPDIIDHDDMLWLPVQLNLPVPDFVKQCTWIFLDECQDLNPVQLRLLEKVLAENRHIRVFAAGDPRQSIYGFRGARHTMENLKRLLSMSSTIEFTLPVCRRCPTRHVAMVKLIIESIAPLDGKEEGELEYTPLDKNRIALGDYVLCRIAKPILALAFEFVQRGIPAKIVGEKSLSHSLQTFFKGVKDAGSNPIAAAGSALRKVKQRLLARGEDRRIHYYEDFYNSAKYIASAHNNNVDDALQVR